MFDIVQFITNFFLYAKPAGQQDWVSVYKQITVHTTGAVPSDLLLKRRPNEDVHVFQYRIENYEPVTYGSMNKAFDALYRLINDINYRLKVSDTTAQYIKLPKFMGMDFKMFMQKIALKYDINDPNGLLVWYPDGEGLTNSSVPVDVKPHFVFSGDIHYLSEDVVSFCNPNERSIIVGDTGQEEMTGVVYWIFTKTEFWKLVQTGKKGDNDFKSQLVYRHAIEEVPCIIMGGDMNVSGYFDSFFRPYLAFGNEAIRQFSDFQAVHVTSAFPYREEFALQCEVRPRDRDTSQIQASDEGTAGSDNLKPLYTGPYTRILRAVPMKDNDWDNALAAEIPSIRFIGPPIEVVKYSAESFLMLLEMAEKALHLNLVGTNQSGEAKDIDNQDKYSMVNKIGNNFFDNMMYRSLKYIEFYLVTNPSTRKSPVIVKPNSFNIRNEQELIEEQSKMKSANVPAAIVSEVAMELARKRFSGNPISQKIFDVIAVADPLYTYSTTEKISLVNSGFAEKAMGVKSTHIYNILLSIAMDWTEDKFLESDIPKIVAEFDKRIVPLLPKQTTLVDDLGKPDPDEE